MYLEHFGLSEAPFRITPHTDFFYAGANRGATLDALVYAVTHDEGIVKVVGEVGSGKTMLCRMLMERLPGNVETIYIANPSLSRDEMLFAIVDELRLDLEQERSTAVIRRLVEHLIGLHAQGRRIVVLVDEAHAMPAETLEQVRLLSNLETQRHKLLQIVLFGQPELNEVLGRSQMRQLKDRITHHFVLDPLTADDAGAYLGFRMRAAGYRGPSLFDKAAIRLIARGSGGLTRRINILADKALLAAYAANKYQVGRREVRAAMRDAELAPAGGRRGWAIAAGAMALATAGIVAYFAWNGPGLLAANREAPLVPQQAAATQAAAAPQTHSAPAEPPAATADRPADPAPEQAPPAPQPLSDPPAAAEEPGHLGALTRERLDRGREWLAQAPDAHWFVQLLTADAARSSEVEDFLARATRTAQGEEIRAYLARLERGERIGVIVGDYASAGEASAAIGRMAPLLRAYGAHPRQVARLRER